MHMLLILLTLCLRKPDGISHLFSIAYAFAGNGWFLDGECMWCGMLFRASPDRMTASLQRELKWLKNQSTLSPPLAAYLQDDPPAARSTDAPSVTVVRSNPAQDKVLRNRFSTLQVVAGPPGTGKTQTIINPIASTVCDQQTVLFISNE